MFVTPDFDRYAPRRAAAYLRCSSYCQPHQPLPGQKLFCREFAKANGLLLAAIYDEPPGTIGRAALRRLMEDASTGAFSQLLILYPAVLGRDPYTLSLRLGMLSQYGLQVRTMLPHADTDGDHSPLRAFLQSRAAKFTARLPDDLFISAAPPAARAAPFPLDGKLFCDHCAAPMRGVLTEGKRWYACENPDCRKTKAEADMLEPFYAENALRLLLTPYNLGVLSNRIARAYRLAYGTRALSALEARIPKLRAAAARAAVHKPDGIRTANTFTMLADAENDLHRLQAGHTLPCPPGAVRAWLESLREADMQNPAVRRMVLDGFVRRAYIGGHRACLLLHADLPNRADGILPSPLSAWDDKPLLY